MSADKAKTGLDTLDGDETPARGVGRNSTGRVTHDDRGNAVWEWSVATGAFSADVRGERVKRLENRTLSLADDAPAPFEVARSNPQGVRKGYNPYDSGKLSKPPGKSPAKKTDLRKLSEWMKLKQQHAKNKDET